LAGGDGVVELAEAGEQMFSIFASDVLNAKVVDDDGEGYRTRLVVEEAGGVHSVGKSPATCCKLCDEAVVGKDSGLRESVRTFLS
jgi:hypothetical protein